MKLNKLDLFEKKHFKILKEELEDHLGLNDIKDDIEKIIVDLTKSRGDIDKQIFDSVSNQNISADIRTKHLLTSMKESSLDLYNNTFKEHNILFLNHLNGQIDLTTLSDYLVIYLYKNSFFNDYETRYKGLKENLREIAELYNKYYSYSYTLAHLFEYKHVLKPNNIIEFEYSIINGLIDELFNSIKRDEGFQELINEQKKQHDKLKNRLEDNVKRLSNDKKELKRKIVSLTYNLEKIERERDMLKSKNEMLALYNDQLTVNSDVLYGDYLFGDYLMLYDKIYQLLIKYNAIYNTPFSLFCLAIQKKFELREKITLYTNETFIIKIMGYLFKKLFYFGEQKEIIKYDNNKEEKLKERFEIMSQGNKKNISKRYLININKTDNFKPNQVELIDEIDAIFDELT